MGSKIKEVIKLMRTKGLKYTYNRVHFYVFWCWLGSHPRLVSLRNRLAPYPSYIEIEVTTRCNLRCLICEHTYWDEPVHDMSFDTFKQIVDQFPGLKWIGLTGIGESFLNKDFLKMVEYVKKRQVFVELYDTFYFIDDKIAAQLVDLKVDKILASIDAATKETYETIRVGSDFQRVIKNVENLILLKRQKKFDSPKIGFHFIINKYNYNEALQYVELVHSIAHGEEVVIQFSRMLHEFKHTRDLFVDVPSDIISAVENRAKELGLQVFWNSDVPKDKPPMNCCIEWSMPFIFSSGHVIPCCAGNEAGNRKFQKDTAMGNVYNERFKDIWYGEKYVNLRKAIRKGEAIGPCQTCCLFSSEKRR